MRNFWQKNCEEMKTLFGLRTFGSLEKMCRVIYSHHTLVKSEIAPERARERDSEKKEKTNRTNKWQVEQNRSTKWQIINRSLGGKKEHIAYHYSGHFKFSWNFAEFSNVSHFFCCTAPNSCTFIALMKHRKSIKLPIILIQSVDFRVWISSLIALI